MGIHASIFRTASYLSPANIMAGLHEVTVVNAEGPFDPSPIAPAVILLSRYAGDIYAVPATDDGGNASRNNTARVHVGGKVWWVVPMLCFGGDYIAASDSRFSQAIEALSKRNFYGAVSLHDRPMDR